jgi:hypothetical protein
MRFKVLLRSQLQIAKRRLIKIGIARTEREVSLDNADGVTIATIRHNDCRPGV